MIRTLCTASLLTCAIASGQSFVSSNAAASSAADPNLARTLTASSLPQFEAVSIKPSFAHDQQKNAIYAYPTGRVFCTHCTLPFLASLAFDLREWQIVGNQDWTTLASTMQYDIDASAPDSSDSSEPYDPKSPLSSLQRQMLQSLLIERFRIAAHRETRSDTVFVLQKGDQPLKLVPPLHPNETHWAGGPSGGPIGSTPGLSGRNITLPELAARLSAALQHPVIDRTRLSGRFDFQARPDDLPANAPIGDNVSASIRAIGLKLTPASGPVEILIVDHAEPPAQN
jgi:uncharacterized protein (TIGR03435 family)